MHNMAARFARPLGRTTGTGGSRIARAARRFDAWTVEAFNPVFPHRRAPRS